MAFITTAVYSNSDASGGSQAPINTSFIKLTKEFCSNTIVRAQRNCAMPSNYSDIYYPEDPFFVIGNNLYCAGVIGDATLSSNEYTVRFVVYHMDTSTYTTGTIPIPWFQSSSNAEYHTYYYIQPIKRIDNLKFLAFVMCGHSYTNGSLSEQQVDARCSCIIDYNALTVTKIAEIADNMKLYTNFYPGIQSKIYLANDGYYLNDSRYGDLWYNHLYTFNINNGSYTLITEKAPCCIYTNSSGVECGLAMYSEYEDGYGSYGYHIVSEGLSSWKTVKSGYKVEESWFPHHFRLNVPIFIIPNERPCLSVNYIDSLSYSNSVLNVRIIGDFSISKYVGSYPFKNNTGGGGRKEKVQAPMVVDYSKPNVVWSLPYTVSGNVNEYIAKFTIDMEAVKND